MLLGCNGVGKSMVIFVLLGLCCLDVGSVELFGGDL